MESPTVDTLSVQLMGSDDLKMWYFIDARGAQHRYRYTRTQTMKNGREVVECSAVTEWPNNAAVVRR